MKLTACRSCGAPIYWLDGPNGKSIPVNKQSERRVILITRALGPGEPDQTVARFADTYVPHPQTCRARDKEEARAAEPAAQLELGAAKERS